VGDRFAPGDLVRTSTRDPAGHTRLPRYARGAVGDRARGRAPGAQAVYHVRFPAAELFGDGEHAVTVELWESYLEPVENRGRARP
jgi:hypothetical protein